MDLRDRGKIDCITLPTSWVAAEKKNRTNNISFSAPEDKDVVLSFFFRGRPVDEASARDFLVVLNQSPHDLDAEEREMIEMIIRDAAEAEFFDLQSARTEFLHSQMTLVIEGKWKLSGLASLGFFVDETGDGTIVQEIYYLAPEAKFAVYLDEVRRSLSTIKWKP